MQLNSPFPHFPVMDPRRGTASKIAIAFVLHGVLFRPFLGSFDGGFFVGFPRLGYVVSKRIVGIRRREQRLDGQQHRSDLEGRTPFV